MNYIKPTWPAPKNITALTTTRNNGFSKNSWDSFNLGLHVDDNPEDVQKNRDKLTKELGIQPIWLNQIHGKEAVILPDPPTYDADAAITRESNITCAVMTADCLPILLCSIDGQEVAAIHGGWKSLLAGVIENTVAKMQSPVEQIMVWLGPAISIKAFELNEDIKKQFIEKLNLHKNAFNNLNYCDLYQIAKNELQTIGITKIYGGDYCTYTQSDLFFSYRRDNITGRMATIIWKTS
jgi:YfiH family protein